MVRSAMPAHRLRERNRPQVCVWQKGKAFNSDQPIVWPPIHHHAPSRVAEDIIDGDDCPYCGKPIQIESGEVE